MPNRLTRVPRGPVPPAGRAMAPVVLAADAFMALMLSRPGGLSLRTTWVTPATMLLASATAVATAALGGLLATHGGWAGLLGAAAALALCLGSVSVLAVAAAQRRGRRRPQPPHAAG